jgi:hypothetical protein
LEDVAEGEETLEVLGFVDDHQPVHAGFADGFEDGVEAIVHGTCVDASVVLQSGLAWLESVLFTR